VTERTTAMKEVVTPMISDATGAAGNLNRGKRKRHEFPHRGCRSPNRAMGLGLPKPAFTALTDPDHCQNERMRDRQADDRRAAPNGATAEHLDAIVEQVASTFHFSTEEFRARKREQHLSFCRQVAMYLCWYAGASLPAVGRSLSRDHSTVLYSVRLIERRLQGGDHNGFRASIKTLERQIIPAP
jgi:Bacterial dnaA protein helix-turn-helix